jgi:hypothetical protein
MLDQEKSDFLKAKILAEKGKTPAQSDQQSKQDMLEKEKTVDASVKLLSWIAGAVSLYFTQEALFTKFSTVVPFGFWETIAIYLCFTTSVKYLLNIIKSIGLAFRKV